MGKGATHAFHGSGSNVYTTEDFTLRIDAGSVYVQFPGGHKWSDFSELSFAVYANPQTYGIIKLGAASSSYACGGYVNDASSGGVVSDEPGLLSCTEKYVLRASNFAIQTGQVYLKSAVGILNNQ